MASAEAVTLGVLFMRHRGDWARSATAVGRGRLLAERSGCFACHGDGGAAPIPNPGATGGEVPRWTGGTWMMWNRKESDVRDWIALGHPADRVPNAEALLQMPGYGGHLSSREIDDLVAYVLAVSQFGWPQEPGVADGREVSVKFGCFGCHGPEGRGTVANLGSFKGYIPAWDGGDYAELVRDDAEFDQWVRQGVCDRLRDNPAARYFLDSQIIRMPAYRDRLSAEELAALRAYVRWVRAHPRTAASAR